MIRATTGGVLRSYRKNLMSSFITDNKARETVLTQRVFNSYAEDPAAAAKAFRLRKSRMMTSSQLEVCDDTYRKYQGAFSCLQAVSELIDTANSSSDISTLKDTALRMLNDPEGDARVQLNKVLDNLSETIIQNLNQTYGDEFIFAGADGRNVPFTVEEKDGVKQLFYRGVPVDANEPNLLKIGSKTEPAMLMHEDGTVQYLSSPGLGNEPDCYLKLDNITKMSVREYEELYTLPNVELKNAADPDQGFVEYNKDGTLFTGVSGTTEPVGPDIHVGGYYRKLDSKGNPGVPVEDNLIKCVDYYAAAERANSAPTVLRFADNFDTAAFSLNNEMVIFAPDGAVTNLGLTSAAGLGGRARVDISDADKDSHYVMIVNGDPKDQVMSKEEYDQTMLEVDKLDYLMKEKRFVDIGLGFQEDENGKLIESSAFNECLNGLTFLGCGLDEDGDPKNIYSLVQRLKGIAAGEPDGSWSKEVYDEFNRVVGKLEGAASEFKTEFTSMSAGTEKLKDNRDLLEDNVYNLKEQYSNLEDVNMADAITSFIWAEYCYNAALKVGNSILSQSLMDYLQ